MGAARPSAGVAALNGSFVELDGSGALGQERSVNIRYWVAWSAKVRGTESGDSCPTESRMLFTTTSSLAHLHDLDRSDRVQTYAQVAETVQRVQAALEARGFRCRNNSALGSLFRKARVLNEQWEAETNGQDILTLMQADEAVRIALAVEAVLDEPEAVEAIRRITKSDMHLSTRQPSQGKDALWELDLHLFLQNRRILVRIQEPDLVVTFPDFLCEYGVACKKVYSEDSVEKQLKKGCRQLLKTGIPGVVAFNLDDITPQSSILAQPTRLAANDFLHARNIAFMERHRRVFQQAVMSGGCDAILLATTAQADIEGMSPRFNRVTQVTLWTVNEAEAGTHIRIAALRRLIEGSS